MIYKIKTFYPLCVIIIGLFFICPAVRADVFNYPLRDSNMNVFTQVCARIAENPIIKGQFEQEKILSRLGRSLKSSGNFIITSDQGMVWETLRPFPSTLALGKDYLVQSRPGGQKSVISADGNEAFLTMAEVLSAVFSGQSRSLLENFEVYFSGNVSSWEIGLLPLDKTIASFAEKISMRGGAVIQTIIMHELNGDSIIYNLSGHTHPSGLTQNEKELFSAN